jgi:uncharacterized membrane protein
MGENDFAPVPTALYGFVLLMAALAYPILQRAIIRSQGAGSLVRRALGRDLKGRLSPLGYGVAIACAFIQPWVSCALYALVALLWLIPDRRIERVLAAAQEA